jgi:hypothetical protein
MRGFERRVDRSGPGGERVTGYVASVDGAERALLSVLAADVAELLGVTRGPDGAPLWPVEETQDGPRLRLRTGPVEAPRDEAVRRLLPDASRDDAHVAGEFRRLTEDDLRAGKIARLALLWDLVTAPGVPADELVVPAERAQDVAATLTDVRLVLAERLDVRTDEDADALYDVLDDEPDHPRHARDDTPVDGVGADDATRDDTADDERAVRRYLVSVYGALGLLQESLVELLLEDLRRGSHRVPGRGGTASG